LRAILKIDQNPCKISVAFRELSSLLASGTKVNEYKTVTTTRPAAIDLASFISIIIGEINIKVFMISYAVIIYTLCIKYTIFKDPVIK